MTDKYCPRAKIKKLEVEMWNLKVKGTDVVGYNQRFQELALMCVRMFPKEPDKIEKYVGGLPDMIHRRSALLLNIKLRTRGNLITTTKLNNNPPPKKQGVAIAYAAGSGKRKESPAATNNQRNLTCYECGNQGHYRSDCPELKNQNHGNQAGGTRARGMEGLCHAESSHHVTFVNESIFTYILEKQSSARRHLIPNPKPRSRDTSLVALGQSAIKLARQKSYADLKRKPMEFQVGDRIMLKVGAVAYKLKLPQELSRVHNMFHVSNLKKCYADEPLAVPLDGLHIDDKLHFVEEPVKIMDREVKRLRQSRVPIVKVRWNSRRGPEFT
ncbi:putative reverse transcriptase domain-containing protein [Tanacetum coccineum]